MVISIIFVPSIFYMQWFCGHSHNMCPHLGSEWPSKKNPKLLNPTRKSILWWYSQINLCNSATVPNKERKLHKHLDVLKMSPVQSNAIMCLISLSLCIKMQWLIVTIIVGARFKDSFFIFISCQVTINRKVRSWPKHDTQIIYTNQSVHVVVALPDFHHITNHHVSYDQAFVWDTDEVSCHCSWCSVYRETSSLGKFDFKQSFKKHCIILQGSVKRTNTISLLDFTVILHTVTDPYETVYNC